jgi:WXG100 family type VII secretion target
MSTVRVTFHDLDDAAAMLARGAGDIQGQLDGLKSRLSTIHASWEGAASAQFQSLWAEWDSGARQVREALEGISQLLARASANYQQVEEANRNQFAA